VSETQTKQRGLEPVTSRPIMPGYGVPEGNEGTLPWSHVESRLKESKHYWISTAGPDGQPHSMPVWGDWVDGALYFGVGPKGSRNLKNNPRVSVHLEDGEKPVILEGFVETIKGVEQELSKKLDDAFATKYDWRPSESGETAGEGWRVLRPKTVFAWTSFPSDATKWTF
jgi:hypothetical protein